MLKKAVAILLAASLAFVVAACGTAVGGVGGESLQYPMSFTDGAGRLVKLEHKPETVAVLFFSYADIWVTAGGKVDVTVGETVERGFAEDGVTLVDAGSGHAAIDLEALAAAKPDIVIGTADYDGQVQAAQFCDKAGIPCALFRVETFDDYLGVLKIFCAINGTPEKYAEWGVSVGERIDSMLQKVADLDSQEKTLLFVRAGSSAKSTKAKTASENFVCTMLNELHTVNIAESDAKLLDGLSLENIVADDPEWLFVTLMGDETAARGYMEKLLEQTGWSSLKCVQTGRVVFLPKDLFHFKPNARWAQAYEYLIKILYPELNID